jgi:hypothetical protein
VRRSALIACLFGLLAAAPLAAQPPVVVPTTIIRDDTPPQGPSSLDDQVDAWPWQTPWGLVDLRAIPDGPKIAPNGQEYHPNFSIDIDFNFWIWRSQGLYAFADASLWGEKSEYGVTNGRDGFVATSKREFDFSGGVAWNYAGFWEARAFGFTDNNLNRGSNLVTPIGFTDGFGLENRYYLTSEYSKLGQPGFDVARADFVSFGYYPSKDMVGNNGMPFNPGLFLRAYVTQDLRDWPVYLYGDATFIAEQSFQPKLFLLDVGVAVRPFSLCKQCEFRLGVDTTADLQERNAQNLWYGSVRFIY